MEWNGDFIWKIIRGNNSIRFNDIFYGVILIIIEL